MPECAHQPPCCKDQAQICAAIVEDLFEAIVALSSKSTMRQIIATFNEKGHFIGVVDLRIEKNRDSILRDMRDLSARLAVRDIPAAVANLRRQLEKKNARMSDLAKASLAEAYPTWRLPSGIVGGSRSRQVSRPG
ncbi:MAG: hypothetical protein ACOY3L_10765 [Pseudomonadota bacterium]